jgi:hypothetical protein
MNSCHDNTFLLCIIKREFLNEIQFEGLFDSFFNDLGNLEREPIILSNGFKARIELEVVVADNSGKFTLLSK